MSETKPKPTPGPWPISRDNIVGMPPDMPYLDALPDLLEAAEKALEEMCNTTSPRGSFTEAVDALDAAIAKAKGGD